MDLKSDDMENPKKRFNQAAVSGLHLIPVFEQQSSSGQTTGQRSLSFWIEIQPDGIEEFCSLMKMIMDKLSVLKSNRVISTFKLKLSHAADAGQKKMAVLSVNMDGNTYHASSYSIRWDNAFLNALDNVCVQDNKERMKEKSN